jgi:hypothetical protein
MIIRGLLGLISLFISLNIQAFDESKLAASLGLELVLEGHPYNYFGINTIYVNDALNRQMLVVSDVKGELKEMRIFKQKEFLIVEIPKTDTTYTSMALVGIGEEEIKEKIKTTSVWKTILREFNPFPNAYASDNDCGPTGAGINQSSIGSIAAYYGEAFGKGAMKCINNFIQGFWESTGGQLEAMNEGIANLIKDPKAFWDKKVQEFANLKNIIMHLDVKLKEMATSIAGLPAETITMIICTMVGNLGGDALLAAIMGAAGAGKLLFRLEEYIVKLTRLDKVFSYLGKIGSLKSLSPEFIKKLIDGVIPLSTLNSLNIFATRNVPELLLGAMQCAL